MIDNAKHNQIESLDDTKEFESRSAQRASVYISSTAEDEKIARQFCTVFESRGTPCWYSRRDMTEAMAWPQCIIEAIESSKFFVFFLTESALVTDELVPEVAEACASGRTILVMQTIDGLLNPKLDALLTDSHVIRIGEDLTNADIDRAWSKIVEIESESTENAVTSLSEADDTANRLSATSFLIQLDCLRGTVRGKTSCQLAVGERLVFGRGSEADIFVDDQRASRRHAGLVIERDPKYGLELQLMDLMSRNGTWVRYRRDDDADISKFLEHSQTRIVSGAIIRIGSTDMRVTAVPVPAGVTRVES